MDIKKKKENLIGVIIIVGIFVPLLLLIISDSKSDDWEMPVIYCLCFVGIKVSELISFFIKSRIMLFPFFFIIHVLSYFFLGWIIARLIYPNKKLSEADNPSEPPQK